MESTSGRLPSKTRFGCPWSRPRHVDEIVRRHDAIVHDASSLITPSMPHPERILQPVPHVGGADAHVIALAMVIAAFLAGEDLERLLPGPDRIEALLRGREWDLGITLPVHEQEGAADP